MLKIRQILVCSLSRPLDHLVRITLGGTLFAGSLALLGACGQKGNLYLPTEPAAVGRATLPQATGTALRSTLPTRAASQPTPSATATDTQ